MKKLVLTLALALAAFAARAEEVKLTGVHLCCGSCVKGAEKAAAKSGATVTVDKDAGTVAISAANKAAIQQAVDGLVAAGYYGKSSDASVKLNDGGAKDAKVASAKFEGVHLCCAKCVTAVQKAVGSVPGVKANTAEKNAKVFEVTGDFSPKAVLGALQAAGLTGVVAK